MNKSENWVVFSLTNNTNTDLDTSIFKLSGNKSPLGTTVGYNTFTQSIITVSMNSPRASIYNPINKYLYIVGNTGNQVAVVDTITETLITTISVGTTPAGITYNSKDNTCYVANKDSDDVSVIDCDTDTVITTISVNTSPRYLAYTSNNKMYVTCNTGNAIDVIDCDTNTVVDSISVTAPVGICYNNTDQNVYYTFNTSDLGTINVLTNQITFTGSIAGALGQIFYNQANDSVYIFRENMLYVVGCVLKTLVATVTGITPNNGVLNTIENAFYIADSVNTAIHVVDCNSNTIVTEVDDSRSYRSISFNPDTNIMYGGYSTNKLDKLITPLTLLNESETSYSDAVTELNSGRYILDWIYISADSIEQANLPFTIYNKQPNGLVCTDFKVPAIAPYDKQFVIKKLLLKYVPESQRDLKYTIKANTTVRLIVNYSDIKYSKIVKLIDKPILKMEIPKKVENPLFKIVSMKDTQEKITMAKIKKEIENDRLKCANDSLVDLYNFFTSCDFKSS